MYGIKQSTAVTITFFCHNAAGAPVLGLTNGSFTKRIKKAGGAWAAMTVTIAEGENGWYSIPLSTAHSNTLELLTITFINAGAEQVNLQWRVEAKLTDDLNDFNSASDDVAVVTLVGTTTTNTDMVSAAPTAVQNRTEMDSNSTQLIAIVGDTNELQSDDVPGLIAALNDISSADANAACDTALTDYDGPTNAELDARTIPTANYFDPAADPVANVTLVATTTTNTDMVSAAPTAVQNRQEMDSNSTQLASIKTDTGTNLPALIDDLAVKKNATFSNFEFLMVLTSDGRTPATGLTVTGQRSIDGAGFATVTGTIAEVSNGIYQFDAVAADTNGDFITWRFSSATADDTFVSFKTVA